MPCIVYEYRHFTVYDFSIAVLPMSLHMPLSSLQSESHLRFPAQPFACEQWISALFKWATKRSMLIIIHGALQNRHLGAGSSDQNNTATYRRSQESRQTNEAQDDKGNKREAPFEHYILTISAKFLMSAAESAANCMKIKWLVPYSSSSALWDDLLLFQCTVDNGLCV